MAAEELSLDVAELETRDGIVQSSKDNSKQITYAQLTKGKEILETSVGDVPLKKTSEFRIMGTSKLRLDSQEKVTGEALYAGDIQIPGMLCARILRPPSLGAKLLSADTSVAERMEGIEVVRDGDLVAVLHPSQHMAGKAIATVKAEWEEEKVDMNQDTLFDHILEVATESRTLASEGKLEQGKEAAVKNINSTFLDPYIAHSPIETHTATAMMEDGRMKVWASCQTPYPTRDGIAEELGMDKKDVQLLPIFVGGGFGGKIYNPQAVEAARLAKLTGKPIQLVYTREEEFIYDRLRPAAVVKVDTGLDEAGKITYWDFAVHQGGGREAVHFYDIPNSRTRTLSAPRGTMGHPFYIGAWRAPSVNTNTFARESQMDILAATAGVDPVEFRLRHLEHDPRMANVVKTGAERFGWTPAIGPSGRGYGFAVGIDVGSYVVVFVEAEVDKNTGYVQVKRAVCCQDMGMVVNPQGAILQMEGCMLMGLGYALREEIQFEGRRMISTNYDSYAFTQFNMVPKLDVVIVDSKDETPYGGGEPPIVVMGGAVANAVFDATGARVFRQPLTPERVKEAMG
jgi:isoquinoline 1-oxidoreductase